MKLVTPDKLHEPWRFVDERTDSQKAFSAPSEGAINFYEDFNAGKLFDTFSILFFLQYDDVDVNVVIVFVLVVWIFGMLFFVWLKNQVYLMQATNHLR